MANRLSILRDRINALTRDFICDSEMSCDTCGDRVVALYDADTVSVCHDCWFELADRRQRMYPPWGYWQEVRE